jgi:hypothetical protein
LSLSEQEVVVREEPAARLVQAFRAAGRVRSAVGGVRRASWIRARKNNADMGLVLGTNDRHQSWRIPAY